MTEDHEDEKETVYDKKAREKQLEDDELSPEEEGFMKGYEEADEEKEEKDEKDEEESKEE